jgi:hypothetical protein
LRAICVRCLRPADSRLSSSRFQSQCSEALGPWTVCANSMLQLELEVLIIVSTRAQLITRCAAVPFWSRIDARPQL